MRVAVGAAIASPTEDTYALSVHTFSVGASRIAIAIGNTGGVAREADITLGAVSTGIPGQALTLVGGREVGGVGRASAGDVVLIAGVFGE